MIYPFRLLASGTIFYMVSTWCIADTYQGRVVGVADGDTITVLDASNQQHKIRISGIDAPEKAQDFGKIAKAAMSDRAYGRQVEAECRKLDRYHREICVVRLNGQDLVWSQGNPVPPWEWRRKSK